MCFKNLPIEFDADGNARLREGVSDPYGLTDGGERRSYTKVAVMDRETVADGPKVRDWMIDPVTRVAGALAVHTKLDMDKRVAVEGHSMAMLFRGYELILQGRDPRDAIDISSRACGVCGGVHSTVSSLAIEQALGIKPPPMGIIVRNLGEVAEMLYDHPLHLGLLAGPDYSSALVEVTNPELVEVARRTPAPNFGSHGYKTVGDLMDAMNPLTGEYYVEALGITRLGREMCQLMYGKYPHPSTLVPGGVMTTLSTSTFNEFYNRLMKYVDYSKKLVGIWDDIVDFFLDQDPRYSDVGDRPINLIQTGILPAYQRFARFFNEEYLPACHETVGAWALPNGRAFYDYRVAHYTTTTLSADEIHQIGLDEVARIRSLMDEVIAEVQFDGSFEEFLHFLRTDPQFYFETGEEILREYRNIAKRIDPELVKLFGKLPRMPYGVKAIPAASAPDTTTAYYFPPAADGSRAGYFYANLYRPEVRPKYEMEALTVHEAMPGHHLQIALAQELGDLPEFRRFNGYTAFVEGWGLYSESLGDELGLYTDPYSRFGQLTYEMWRAVRLVVDTGLHAKGWSRQQAIDYFKANAGKAEHDIINEIDRYIAWPGQALAYKIGELKIQALRREAEQALDEQFDIRGFHDTVLGAGAIPLNLLERNVRAWIEQKQTQP